jgi:hypothetical protein
MPELTKEKGHGGIISGTDAEYTRLAVPRYYKS